MTNTGVIIGRFQTHILHQGHIQLLSTAIKENDRVIVIIGQASARLTFTNPLTFEARKKMLRDALFIQWELEKRVHEDFEHKVIIISLADYKSDGIWSFKLDEIIKEFTDGLSGEIKIYSGRDGFQKVYAGVYKDSIKELTFDIDHESGTKSRGVAHHNVINSLEWRMGIIHASDLRYPVSYQTVDIAIYDQDRSKVLLGRKANERKFRFIGGFVDPTDETLELAAKREVCEEAGNICTDQYEYLGSFRIDDWRYRKEKDKVMSVLFLCRYVYGHVEAGDDIEEVKWFDVSELHPVLVELEHEPLMQSLIQKLNLINKPGN